MHTCTRAHVHTQAQEIGGGARGHERLPRSRRRSYCRAARRQENQETGDRDQMSRRDQRNKINVTRNQRETEEPGGGIPEGTVLHIQA